MARQKSSKAIRRTIYINPQSDARQEAAVEILLDLEAQGYNVSHIFVERLLRSEGIDPAYLPTPQSYVAQVIIAEMQTMLERYTDDIMQELKRRGVAVTDENGADIDTVDDDGVSKFARNLARGFIKRQQQSGG